MLEVHDPLQVGAGVIAVVRVSEFWRASVGLRRLRERCCRCLQSVENNNDDHNDKDKSVNTWTLNPFMEKKHAAGATTLQTRHTQRETVRDRECVAERESVCVRVSE